MTTLNRNNSNWSFEERRKINENWDILENLSNQNSNGNNGVKAEIDQLKVELSSVRSTSNTAIQNSARALISAQNAIIDSASAKNSADRANSKSDYVQKQLDDLVVTGDGIAEVSQARNGRANLRQRLDEEYNSVDGRLNDLYVNVKNLGALGNGINDDTQVLQNAFNENKRVFIPNGIYRITSQLNIEQSECDILFSSDSTLILDNSTFNDRAISINGNKNKISLGRVTSNLRKQFLVYINGNDNNVENGEVFFANKSTMDTVPGTFIYYNRAGVGINGSRNTVSNVETFNHEGSGVYIYGSSNKLLNSYIHDNSTGVITLSTTDITINDNIIENNNVNNSEGNDGILATVNGLTVKGNLITGSGEHGTYIHGSNCLISNNIVRGSFLNGIKVGDVNGCVISDNALDGNNAGINVGQAQIYVQTSFQNVTIANNIESNPIASDFISAVSRSNEDFGVTVTGNVALSNITVHAIRDVIISNNRTTKGIYLGFPDSTYPNITNAIVSNNNCFEIRLSRSSKPLIQSNSMQRLIGSGDIEAIIKGNVISNQNIGLDIRVPKEMVGNTIDCTLTTGSFLLQHSAKRSDKTFKDNSFKSAGARFLLFSSQAISSDNLTFIGNQFTGAVEYLNFWGEKHFILNNRSDVALGLLGCNNSIINGNFNAPTLRAGNTGNLINNNI